MVYSIDQKGDTNTSHTENEEKRHNLVRQETMMMLQNKESFSSSFRTIFTASDEEIFERCGDDSLQYLRFQRYIICYLVILMLLSVCLILPLNIQGMLKYIRHQFILYSLNPVYVHLKHNACVIS